MFVLFVLIHDARCINCSMFHSVMGHDSPRLRLMNNLMLLFQSFTLVHAFLVARLVDFQGDLALPWNGACACCACHTHLHMIRVQSRIEDTNNSNHDSETRGHCAGYHHHTVKRTNLPASFGGVVMDRNSMNFIRN